MTKVILTPKENRIFRYYLKGYDTERMASLTETGKTTVQQCLTAIRHKFGAKDRAGILNRSRECVVEVADRRLMKLDDITVPENLYGK